MTTADISKILSDTRYQNADIYAFKHLTGGLMNTIWRVDTSVGRIIVKIYDIERDMDFQLQCLKIWENHLLVPTPIHSQEIWYEGKRVIIYQYISGEEIVRPNVSQLNQILQTINKTSKIVRRISENAVVKARIVDHQYEYIKDIHSTRIDKKVVNHVCRSYNAIRQEVWENSNYISHGDLNHGNILWKENGQLHGVIDFDETSICTSEYELVVFATKHCMIEDSFDAEYLNLILNIYYQGLTNEVIERYKKTFMFYVCKVLMEKISYYQKGLVDLYDQRQIKDNWNWWYLLLNNIDKYMGQLRNMPIII